MHIWQGLCLFQCRISSFSVPRGIQINYPPNHIGSRPDMLHQVLQSLLWGIYDYCMHRSSAAIPTGELKRETWVPYCKMNGPLRGQFDWKSSRDESGKRSPPGLELTWRRSTERAIPWRPTAGTTSNLNDSTGSPCRGPRLLLDYKLNCQILLDNGS